MERKTKNRKNNKNKNFVSLDKIIANMPGSVYWKDIDGIYKGCNNGMLKIIGCKFQEEVIGKNDYDIANHMGWSKELAEKFILEDRSVINQGIPQLNLEEVPFSNIEGEIINQLTNKAPLYDLSGNIVGVVGISIDITTFKKAKEELIFAKEKAEKKAESTLDNLEKIISCMPGNVYWKNKEGVYLGCNKQLLEAAGLSSPEQIIGKTDYEIGKFLNWSPNVAEAFHKVDMGVIESGIPKTNIEELPFPIANGKIIYQLTSKVPLKDENNNVIGVVGISIDITKQKETERMLADQIEKTKKAYHSKTQFLATASHEIRNPIGNVIYSVDATNEFIRELKNTFYDMIDVFHDADKHDEIKKIKNIFKEIQEQSEQTKAESYRALNSLINLGNLHRLQLENIATKYEVSNVKEVIYAAIENSVYPNKNKVDIHVNLNASMPEEIVIDYNNIYETLRVIIGNAIRFSEADGVIKINVKVSEPASNKNLIIAVQDFGIGISEAQLEDLFETLHTTNEEKVLSNYSKPSLQLPQAKMRIEACGGALQIKSAPKKGTTVIITVPYYDPDSEMAHSLLADDEASDDGCVILLVEDDIFAQKVVKSYLQEFMHQVDVAANSDDAIEMVRQKSYDIILMDITLPDRDGVATKQIMQDMLENPPMFIAITSHASEDDIDAFISKGFITVLAKPVNKLMLKKCIEDVIIAKVSEDNEED